MSATFELEGKRYRWKPVASSGGATVEEMVEVDADGREVIPAPPCTCCPVHVQARLLRDAEPWLPEEDAYLRDAVRMGRTLRQMSHNLQRGFGSIEARCQALGLDA